MWLWIQVRHRASNLTASSIRISTSSPKYRLVFLEITGRETCQNTGDLVWAMGIEPPALESSGSIRVKKNSVQLIGLQSNYSPKMGVPQNFRICFKKSGVQVQGTRGHGRLSDLNEVPIRVAHIAPQFRCVDFRLSDEFRATRRPKVVVTLDISHTKVQKDA